MQSFGRYSNAAPRGSGAGGTAADEESLAGAALELAAALAFAGAAEERALAWADPDSAESFEPQPAVTIIKKVRPTPESFIGALEHEVLESNTSLTIGRGSVAAST